MPQVIIGTPGRVVDIINNSKGISFEEIDFLVFDEADKLLDMGFQDEVKFILESTENQNRQTLLLSATLSKGIEKLSHLGLKKPI